MTMMRAAASTGLERIGHTLRLVYDLRCAYGTARANRAGMILLSMVLNSAPGPVQRVSREQPRRTFFRALRPAAPCTELVSARASS